MINAAQPVAIGLSRYAESRRAEVARLAFVETFIFCPLFIFKTAGRALLLCNF